MDFFFFWRRMKRKKMGQETLNKSNKKNEEAEEKKKDEKKIEKLRWREREKKKILSLSSIRGFMEKVFRDRNFTHTKITLKYLPKKKKEENNGVNICSVQICTSRFCILSFFLWRQQTYQKVQEHFSSYNFFSQALF